MSTQPSQARQLVERLRGVRVGLRDDLEVSRHLFRGAPSYVIRDPLTFQSHRLDPADYQVVIALDESRALGDVFAQMVEEDTLREEDDERFYMFVFQLHRLGFLTLPVNDEKLLYRRYRARQQARKSNRLLSLLFWQIPLWNPDTFLTRTAHAAAPLFTRWALLAWLLTLLAAGVALVSRWGDFLEPLNGLLATRNLILIWVLLILLKTAHEFGHAYACKLFGGHVPEMGVVLIAGTPCAYVDATASWGFSQRSQRLIVALAGMYIETWIAAFAVFVWVLTGPGLLNAAAYNVVFLAGVTTILFNINPLMRYDGYYVVSDLTGIPNLRPRAQRTVGHYLRRYVLGLAPEPLPWTRGMKQILLGFGAAATGYRVLVMLGISALLAAKLGLIGLAAAGVFLVMSLFGWIRRTVGWLWFGDETAPVRGRAVAASLALLLGVPAGAALLPVEVWSQAPGVLRYEHETVVRADSAGFLRSIAHERGAAVHAGTALLELDNPMLREASIFARETWELAEARVEILSTEGPAKAAEERVRLASLRDQVRDAERRVAQLSVRADQPGLLLRAPAAQEVGRYYEQGEPLATIARGAWQVQMELTTGQVSNSDLVVGSRVEFRPARDAEQSVFGTVARIEPRVSRQIDEASLTQAGGGEIVVTQEGESTQPYLTVTVTLEPTPDVTLSHGLTGQVGFRARHLPAGLALYRQFVRFVDRLRQG